MKENKFKVGDRVRVYDRTSTDDVTVTEISGDLVGFVALNGWKSAAHFKQCRRIVPKKKKTGDEIWVNLDRGIFLHGDMCGIDPEKLKDSPEPWIKYKRCK